MLPVQTGSITYLQRSRKSATRVSIGRFSSHVPPAFSQKAIAESTNTHVSTTSQSE